MAELSSFDSRAIALAVAGSPWPVLSGIGHEINTTVTDLAAHTYLKTPTAVAQFLNQRVRNCLERLDESAGHVVDAADKYLLRSRDRVKGRAAQLESLTLRYFRDARQAQARLEQTLRQLPQAVLRRCRETNEREGALLIKTIALRFNAHYTKIAAVEKMVDFASPRKILKRGFSVTRDSRGKAIRDVSPLLAGELVMTELAGGRIESRVTALHKEE